MKHVRKVFTLMISAVMMMALAVTAFAAGTGSITITPPKDVEAGKEITYKIYKVFDADGNGTAISYKLVSGKTTAPAGFTVDAAGNVTYTGTGTDGLTEADITAIAAYVTDADLVATVTTTAGTDAVAEDLPNGYYYITTSIGTVVTIDSTNPDAKVKDKNSVPFVDKKITGATSYDDDGKAALAQVGTEVEYTATVTVGVGRIGYVFNDTMSAGLEYVADSLTVAGMTAGTDYNLTVEGQKITVEFVDASIAALDDDSEIVITYKAKVTSDALQDDPANNTATISYGNESQYTSEPSETEVYNAKISVLKQDEEEKPLAGAGFVLKNADGKYYKIDNKVVSWVDSIGDATEYTSGADGKLDGEFTGLANGTYTLEEKTVPAGYNAIDPADPSLKVVIEEHDYSAENLKQVATVINKAGTVLPSTGGIGTTIFYTIGTILVIGAGIILVSKRRMNA